MTAEPPRILVLDSSALVALLGDAGPAGSWVTGTVTGMVLAAPQLAPFEAANILRRQASAGVLDDTAATLAHADLLALPLQLWPYEPLAARAWQLRHSLTICDASYVALAELLSGVVITLDARLSNAPGLCCPVVAYRPEP